MHGYRDELYGDRAAERYDDLLANFEPPAEMIALLGTLAGGGDAVEIGVGTGRVALPLARAGVPVTGIDVSPEMINQLSSNSGSLAVTGLVADATSFTLAKPASLIYCVFNTLYQIQGVSQQAEFLRNAARNLSADGSLLLENGILKPAQIGATRGVNVKYFDAEKVILQVFSHDADHQVISKQEAILEHGKPVHLIPSIQHYLSHEQILDLADDCGLVLAASYSTWTKHPVTPDSDKSIVIFRKKH